MRSFLCHKPPEWLERRNREWREKKGTKDRDILLRYIAEGGERVGNTTLKTTLAHHHGWNEHKYWRVRDELIADGTVERAKGKGGSVRRVAEDAGEEGLIKSSRNKSLESSLYLPLRETLAREWIRDMGIKPDQIKFEITAKQGAKQTGGKWSRPDITAVSVRSFYHLPTKYLDIWTFEVKTVEGLDATAVLEAAAHASRATRSYALLQIPEKTDKRTEEIIERCEHEAARLGVGLITFSDATRFDTWETRVDAPRLDTAPEYLQEFINLLSEEMKEKVGTWIK